MSKLNKTCRICARIHTRRGADYCSPTCKNIGNFGDACLRNVTKLEDMNEDRAAALQVYLQTILQSATRVGWDASRTDAS